MAGGKGNIKPADGKQFSSTYQPNEKWTEKKALEVGYELLDWLRAKDEKGNDKKNIFFEEFLYLENDYYSELIAYLSNKFTSFLKLIGKAKKIQELKLYKYGVQDDLNANMTKFVLINEHSKVSDNKVIDNKSTDGSMSPQKLDAETAKAIAKGFEDSI